MDGVPIASQNPTAAAHHGTPNGWHSSKSGLAVVSTVYGSRPRQAKNPSGRSLEVYDTPDPSSSEPCLYFLTSNASSSSALACMRASPAASTSPGYDPAAPLPPPAAAPSGGGCHTSSRPTQSVTTPPAPCSDQEVTIQGQRGGDGQVEEELLPVSGGEDYGRACGRGVRRRLLLHGHCTIVVTSGRRPLFFSP